MKLTVTKKYTDWLVLLTDLANGTLKLGYDQLDQIQSDAANWPSCACGQLCGTLPRTSDGAPRDGKLADLGVQFMNDLNDERYTSALQTFKAIERRSTALLDAQKFGEAVKAATEKEAARPVVKPVVKVKRIDPYPAVGGYRPNYDTRY